MNPTEQIEQMVNTWAGAQHQLWAGWLGQGGEADVAGKTGARADGMDWLSQAAELWGADGILGRTMGNLLNSQEMLGHSVELLAKAWQQVVPQLESGQDWQPALRKYLDGWIAQIASAPQQGLDTSKEATQLLSSVLTDWSPVIGPWMSSAYKASLDGSLGATLLKSSEGFGKLLAMEQEFEPAIAGLAEVPRAGLLRERNAKILLTMDALVALRSATVQYQGVVAKGLAEAVEATVRHIVEQAQAGNPVQGVRGLVRTWFRTADKTLMHTFSTAEFIAAQNQVAAASMDFKIRKRELLGMVYDALEIPTRGELDDVYRTIHDLKREVRELRRAQRNALRNQAGAVPQRELAGAAVTPLVGATATNKATAKKARGTVATAKKATAKKATARKAASRNTSATRTVSAPSVADAAVTGKAGSTKKAPAKPGPDSKAST